MTTSAIEWTSETTEKGVTERGFTLRAGEDSVPGIAWTPKAPTQPGPTVLLGHGGTQHKRTEGLLSLARRLVRHLGYSAVAIDAPGHGDRRSADEPRVPVQEMRRRLANMSPEEARAWAARNRQGGQEWRATLDAISAEPHLGTGPYGYWGVSMGTAIGLPFVASEPRVSAAVFGLAGIGNRPGAEALREAARSLRVPVLFLYQWDDELMTRESGIALFDAIGSAEKTMHVNPGGHVQIPRFERDAVEAFFSRHLEAVPQSQAG